MNLVQNYINIVNNYFYRLNQLTIWWISSTIAFISLEIFVLFHPRSQNNDFCRDQNIFFHFSVSVEYNDVKRNGH